MTIYLDVVFFENVCMDYIILVATIVLMKRKFKPVRILISSVLGALYAVLTVLNILPLYNSMIFKILVSIIMIYIAVDTNGFKNLFKTVLIFYLVSFTFGGVTLALLYFVKPEDILMKNGIYIGTYPVKTVFMGGIVGFAIISAVFSIIKNRIVKSNTYCEVNMVINSKNVKTKSLVDTGNFLKEPITGMPVVIAEQNILKEVIPNIILKNVESIINGEIDSIRRQHLVHAASVSHVEIEDEEEADLIDKYITRFKVIPFDSLGKQNGILLGLKADYIEIITEEETKRKENVVVAMYNKDLSKNGDYHAIIGFEVVTS
ncbi:MAG: sigma-E processing peptidase SpoIIGA [Oscillospiraceae bacterium]|nr:sigma-E processing peptidase SpoIIGA [Oscillospiraceae bacterium]